MRRKPYKFFAFVFPSILLLIFLFIGICMLNRWDSMVSITLIPLWIWMGFLSIFSLFSWILSRHIFPSIVFTLTLLTAVVFSEESRSVGRELLRSVVHSRDLQKKKSDSLQIVSVRCHGSEAALQAAAEAAPDVILIQGAPSKSVLDSVAERIYGSERTVTSHGSLAILARGSTLAVIASPSGRALHVRLRHPSGLILDVTDLDLEGCAPRRDMWKPSVWRELTAARVGGRRFVRNALGENPITRQDVARVVGGHFGTPAGDDVFGPLENNSMIDTFGYAGIGWGDTSPNRFPFLRTDQIWVSPTLHPIQSTCRLDPAAQVRVVASEVQIPTIRRPPS